MELNHRPHIRFRLLYVESEQLNFRRVTRAKTDRAGSAHLYSGARDRHARNLWARASGSIARGQWRHTCGRSSKM